MTTSLEEEPRQGGAHLRTVVCCGQGPQAGSQLGDPRDCLIRIPRHGMYRFVASTVIVSYLDGIVA